MIMKKSFSIIVLLVALFAACNDGEPRVSCPDGVKATLRNLTGLDGCGFVFELADGTKLEPQLLMYCGTPPLPKEVTEDPLYNFEWVDGKQVIIAYKEIPEMGSFCMVGPIVKITCLEEIPFNDETL